MKAKSWAYRAAVLALAAGLASSVPAWAQTGTNGDGANQTYTQRADNNTDWGWLGLLGLAGLLGLRRRHEPERDIRVRGT